MKIRGTNFNSKIEFYQIYKIFKELQLKDLILIILRRRGERHECHQALSALSIYKNRTPYGVGGPTSKGGLKEVERDRNKSKS